MISATYPVDGKLRDGTPVKADVPLILQSPVMTTSFGMSTQERDGTIKGGVDLTFNDMAPDNVMAFKDVMTLFDRLLLEKAKECKLKWFKSNKMTDAILDYLYIPMVRENIRKSDGQRFADTLRPKIRRRNNKFVCEVFDADGNPISIDEITPRCQIKALLSQTGIWLSESMFVSSFEASQIQMMASGSLSGYSFVDDEPAPMQTGFVE